MTTSLRAAALFLATVLAACGSGKAGSPATDPYVPPSGPQVAGLAVPREISALPARVASGVSVAGVRLAAAPFTAAAASGMAAGTDYANAETFKFVDEQALAQFDILNTIFKALGETHYADPENVNTSAYKCMVTWDEKGGSSTGKQLVPWVVESIVTTPAGGQPVNRVNVWMSMKMGDGQVHVIKVALDVSQAPTQNADGSYADYGVWRMDAKFDDSAAGYFVATAEHGAGGLSVIKIHQVDTGGGGGASGPAPETRGILTRSATSGYGVVSFPDWSSCHDPVCAPPSSQVSYAYNADHAALKQGATVVFKDRAAVVDIGNRYGLYDAVTGADVTKSRSFGFPVTFSDALGTHWGYYGAWQGRHQLGYDGMNAIPAGTIVTRADLPPGAPAETFEASAVSTGTLVKRTLSPGDIQGLSGVVVQTWMNSFVQLTYDGASWLMCPGGQPVAMMTGLSGTTWECRGPPGTPTTAAVPYTSFSDLQLNPSDPQKQVMINLNRMCQAGQPCAPTAPAYLVYDQTGLFYTGWTPSPGAPAPTSNGIAYVPQSGDQLFVNISGPLYLSYGGAGFVSKRVASLDERTMTPTFDPAGDVSYALEQGREYYFNTPGVNYVVKATAPGVYDVKVELQTVANPVNAATFVPAGTTFRPQWDQSACSATCSSQAAQSTYRFDAATMKLVYACVGTGDQQSGATVGAEVKTGQWGLVAYDASCTRTTTQYNWDYPQGNQGWGGQQYLKRADGSYVILEDPIRLEPVQLANHHGDLLTLSLQFDGNWVNGLPDVYKELQENDFVLTAPIADKVVLIPAGTEVVDASDATKHYLFKPLQLNEYLAVIADPGDLDPSLASSLDLSTVPSFVDAHLGPVPNVPLKYSEGKLVQ